MRTASRCFARLPSKSHPGRIINSRSGVLPRTSPLSFVSTQHNPGRLIPTQSICRRLFTSTARHGRRSRPEQPASQPSPDKALGWVAKYDKFLPPQLRLYKVNAVGPQADVDLDEIRAITLQARKKGIDLWLWMVQNGYRRSLVALLHQAFQQIAARQLHQTELLPSNIRWPTNVFDALHYNYSTPHMQNTTFAIPDVPQPSLDTLTAKPRQADSEQRFMGLVWSHLAKFVLTTVDHPPEQENPCMTTTLLILGILHHLEMVPKDLYTYEPPHLSSTVVRPPILHLVSSRILTALSDAAWREQQDYAIDQATQLGVSLKHISENVPGGRFRLKVRPLPREIWLELILWCCVDGDYHMTAFSTIDSLRLQHDNPWFAVRWCPTHSSPAVDSLVDWNRVKLRHGGAVGLIEGYSREKPFVDVPQRTISVELVLALIERYLATVNEPNPRKHAMARIIDLISFLEPHDLPASYFDYLESRLVQVGAFNVPRDPSKAQLYSNQMLAMRATQRIKHIQIPTRNLHLDCVLDHGLLHLGVKHQVLEALLECGAVHNALEVFNEIQEEVDRNKFRSITEFLLAPMPKQKDFFSSTPKDFSRHRLEYADSHGQIPYHKLASFLDLATEAGMIGLGEWLLYSDDLDDVLIPESSYALTCLAPSLSRYAATAQDDALLTRVISFSHTTRPSIRASRAFFDAHVLVLEFGDATRQLHVLKDKQAGGYGLSNVAYLANAILRIENDLLPRPSKIQSYDVWKSRKLNEATALMRDILSGRFDSTRSDFTLSQMTTFKQQVTHLLRVFAQCKGSVLQTLAFENVLRYAEGHSVGLPAKFFNVLLDGFVQAYGPYEARDLWNKFCKVSSAHVGGNLLSSKTVEYDSAGDISDAPSNVASEELRLQQSDEEKHWFITPHDPETHDSASVEFAPIYNRLATRDVHENLTSAEFHDPFFSHSTKSETSVPAAQGSLHSDSIITKQAPSEEHIRYQRLRPSTVVIPTASTLRTIVRAVVDMPEDQMVEKGDLEAWAVQQFLSLGTSELNVIAQEIQRPLSDLDIAPVLRGFEYQKSET